MALAEHEVVQQEVTQGVTVRFTGAQVTKIRQAAEAKGQSVEDFIVSASVHTVEGLRESLVLPAGHDPLDSIIGIFKDSPELDALMERIHEEQRQGIEQFRLEAEAEDAVEQANALRQ